MAPMTSSLLSMQGVRADLGGRRILDDFSLDAAAGETILITGPSGAGKTTLLRTAAGLLRPVSGSVVRRCERMGFVFQTPRLIPWRSVRRNIELPVISLLRCGRSEAAKLAEGLLEDLGLAHAADEWPGALSGGMAHRVSLARALAVQPDFLLLDEPMTGLDEEARENALAVLRRYLETRRPVCLFVTHSPETAETFAARRLELSDLRRS